MATFINTVAQKKHDKLTAKIKELEAQVEKTQDEQFGTQEGSQKILALYKALGKLEDELKQLETDFTQIVDASIDQRFKLRITTEDKAENDQIEKAVRYATKKVFFLANVTNYLSSDEKNKLMLQQIEQRLSSHDVGLSGSHIWIHNSSHERVAIITKLY